VTTLGPLFRINMVLSWRRGVIAASASVVGLYIVVLNLMPTGVAVGTLPYLVFSDPAALGFFFVGGIVLADRAEGTVAAVWVTPARPWQMLAARVGSLGSIAVVSAALIATGSRLSVRWEVFLAAVVPTALLFTFLGYAVAMRSRSVNDYFARATVVSIPLFAPIGVLVVAPTSPWLGVWPSTASLVLLRSSVPGEGIPTPSAIFVPVATLVLTCVIAGWWAHFELSRARREGRG
jgi:fluoroquinolone transport system permease protein